MRFSQKLMSMLIAGTVSVGTFVACKSIEKKDQLAASSVMKESEIASSFRIMSSDKISQYQKVLPSVGYETLHNILRDSATYWYDKKDIIPAYQDSVGEGEAPIGARANSRGQSISLAKHLFDGDFFKFPFGHTAGTDKSTNVEVINFMHLPKGASGTLPIVYWVEKDKRKFGISDTKWKWMFPKGAVVGELIFVKDSSGSLFPSEIRTRTKYLEGWAVNVYRPFDSAAKLAEAIKAKRANWQDSQNLKSLVNSLEGTGQLRVISLKSAVFPGSFEGSGATEDLPDFGDEALVRELLVQTPFVSCYGTAWRKTESQTAFAPSSKASFSIVPNNYEAGLFEVNEKSCSRCHQDAGRAIVNYEKELVLYGDIWGEDQIFSFHPYDHSKFGEFNNENRTARADLLNAGIIAKYEPGKHGADTYIEIPLK